MRTPSDKDGACDCWTSGGDDAGSVAVATFQRPTRTRWYGWFCTVVATLGILSVIDTVSVTTGGIFAMLGFAGFVLWVLITGIVMYRRPLMS